VLRILVIVLSNVGRKIVRILYRWSIQLFRGKEWTNVRFSDSSSLIVIEIIDIFLIHEILSSVGDILSSECNGSICK